MFRNQRASRGVFAALLAGSVTLAAASNAAASGTVKPAALGTTPQVQVPSHAVTLVTGDRLALADDGQVTVQYNPNRKDIGFTTYKQLGDVYAIPSDAAQLVVSGQLDPTLFDLTRLLAYGSKTQSTATDVIVQYTPGAAASVHAALTGPANGGAKVTHQLGSVNGTALRVPHATTSEFWNSVTTTSGHLAKLRTGVHKLWLDQVLKPTDAQSTPQVGAPTAWAAG